MDITAVRSISAAVHSTHRYIYFVPEIFEAAAGLGVPERASAYFAFRSAALGAAPWQVTHAIFYNFSPRAVQAMSGVWNLAPPERWQIDRFAAADSAMQRVGVPLSGREIAEARGLIDPVVAGADYSGRPLAAANASVALPDSPLVALWQQLTVLREWRGDAHALALAMHRVGSCECNVLQAATGRFPSVPVARATRLWSDAEWSQATTSLVSRGWLDADGVATATGYAARERIEVETDQLCASLWAGVDEPAAAKLIELISPIDQAFVAAGTFG